MGKPLTVGLLFVFLAGLLPAQAPPELMRNVGARNLPAQVIGVNDLVAISVYRSPELTRTARVGTDGAIALPLLKNRIGAAGLLPIELEAEIVRALKEEGMLVNPIVEVTVAEYASRPISVIGAVNKPLTFQAVGRVTLVDALARAEGLRADASQEVLVSVPSTGADSGANHPLVRRVPVKALIDEADPKWNFQLTGGEEIRVPAAGKIFVLGNVKKPGSYPVPDPADASVMRMIGVAEGLVPYYRKTAYIYREEPDTGLRREIEVELAKMLKREVPDMPLLPNDVLYIPDSTSKRTRAQVIEYMARFGIATASGFLIWGRR